jgi:hypothetical protein
MAKKIMKGVYCVDIDIKAVPKEMKGKMVIVKKEVESVPMALDENLKPINNNFIEKYLNVKDVNSYTVSYAIKNKKYLSSINY